MAQSSRFLVFGATGGTGKHFVSQVLADGHSVRALARSPEKLTIQSTNLEVRKGAIDDDDLDLDALVANTDYIVAMVGDRTAQQTTKISTPFVKKLVPCMRRHGVKRFLYQAGGLSRPYGESLTVLLWTIRYSIARGFEGQHQDNEAVMEYLATEANDIEWIVHRAGIGGDGPSKGKLERSHSSFSVGTHRDCADYNYRTVMDPRADRTADFSHYAT